MVEVFWPKVVQPWPYQPHRFLRSCQGSYNPVATPTLASCTQFWCSLTSQPYFSSAHTHTHTHTRVGRVRGRKINLAKQATVLCPSQDWHDQSQCKSCDKHVTCMCVLGHGGSRTRGVDLLLSESTKRWFSKKRAANSYTYTEVM